MNINYQVTKIIEESKTVSIENETVEEISESEWNKRTINIWEDNDFSKKPYKTSIRENICGKETQMLFTNDFSTFN